MLALIASLLILPGSSAAGEDRRAALMDRIEATITLPPNADPFGAYGRYYAFAGPDRVRGVYVRRPDKPYFTEGCRISNAQGSRECTQAEVDEANAGNQRLFARYLPPGQRRWFDDPGALPDISDGGCMVVTFDYDVRTDRIADVACNARG